MKQGSVIDVDGQKFVVLTGDDFNEVSGFWPAVAPLVRSRGFSSEYLIETNETDQVSGSIAVPFVETLSPEQSTTAVTMIGGITMGRLLASVKLMYGLPE